MNMNFTKKNNPKYWWIFCAEKEKCFLIVILYLMFELWLVVKQVIWGLAKLWAARYMLLPLLQVVWASTGSVSWQNTLTAEVYNRAGMSWQGNQTQPGHENTAEGNTTVMPTKGQSFVLCHSESCPGSCPSQQTWELLVQGFPRSHYYNNTRICPTGFVTPWHTKTHCKRLQTGLADTQAHLP